MFRVISAALTGAASSGPSLVYVGDWGGDSDSQPTTAAQITTAAGMAKVAQNMKADSILLLGDNFYNSGVKSVDSSRFEKTFEDVYTSGLFGDLQFHVIAGNHDHKGDVQAQIDYSSKSSHWNFPSLYYSLDWDWTTSSGEQRSAQLLMIDTSGLAGVSEDFSGVPHTGPSNYTCAASQWTWIEEQLSGSKADFLWVAGHYPIYSAGDDGTEKTLVKQLLPLLKKYGAHYICGHDHLVQHLDMDGVQQFQNGMGMECCYGTSHMSTVPDGYIQYLISGKQAQGTHVGPGARPPKVQGGFNTMEFGDELVTITSMMEDGEKLYSAQVPRRTTALQAV